jgi:hypothetical protein
MPPDLIELLIKRLDTIDAKLDRVQEQQIENALKIRTLEVRLASYAGMAGLLAAAIIQIIDHVFFS